MCCSSPNAKLSLQCHWRWFQSPTWFGWFGWFALGLLPRPSSPAPDKCLEYLKSWGTQRWPGTPPESSWDYTPMKMDGLYMVSTGKSQSRMDDHIWDTPMDTPSYRTPRVIFPGRAQKLQPLGSHQNSWHTNINVHLLHESSTSFKTSPNLGIPFMEHSQWEFQDPKMEVPAIRPIFPGYASGDISPISMAWNMVPNVPPWLRILEFPPTFWILRSWLYLLRLWILPECARCSDGCRVDTMLSPVSWSSDQQSTLLVMFQYVPY